MALGNSSSVVYLSIADGKIVQRVKQDTPGAVQRMKKNNEFVYELRYAFVSGIVTNITTKTNIYQGAEMKDWLISLRDGNEDYLLQVMFDSRYATSLLFALANPIVDFSKPITFTPWMKVVGDKKKTSVYVRQSEDIKWFFTQENPNGMPDLEKVNFQGKDRWDSFKRMQFLEKYIETKIKPKLINPTPVDQAWSAEPSVIISDNEAGYIPSQMEDDDLPF